MRSLFSPYLFHFISNGHCTILTRKFSSKCTYLKLVSFLHALPRHRKSTSQLHIFGVNSWDGNCSQARVQGFITSPVALSRAARRDILDFGSLASATLLEGCRVGKFSVLEQSTALALPCHPLLIQKLFESTCFLSIRTS